MKNKPSTTTATTLIVIGSLARLLPHPANFTPVGAAALLGGATLLRPWNYLVPLITMALTDIFLGLHGTMLYVYGSFVVTAYLGEKWLRSNRSLHRVALISFSSSLIFFIVTNFGVWLSGGLYPKTWDGLVMSYLMGLPFWRNMLAADLVFGVGFFAVYAWAERQAIIHNVDKQLVKWFGRL